jgi:phosphoketolase
LRLYRRANRDGNPRQLTSEAPAIPYGLADRAAHLRQQMEERRLGARLYTREHGEDPPDVRDWTWPH